MGEVMEQTQLTSIPALLGLDQMNEQEIRMMNPIIQAYIGDAVYEVYIRTHILHVMKGSVHELNKRSVTYVRAVSQAQIVHALEDVFTDEEKNKIRRGRNQKSISVPKNASISDYRYATGFEAMIGWLYLTGQYDRIGYIVQEGIKVVDGLKEKESAHE